MGELHRAVRAGPDPGEIGDGDAVERPVGRLRGRLCGYRAARAVESSAVVLAEAGSRAANGPPPIGEPGRRAGHSDAAQAGLVVGDQEVSGSQVRVGGHLRHRVDGREGQPLCLAPVEQLHHRLRSDPFAEPQAQQVFVLEATLERLEEVHVGPLRAAHEVLQPLPLVGLDAHQEDVPVTGREDPPRIEDARPQPAGVVGGVGPDDERGFQHPDDVGHLGEVDVLAAAGALSPVDGCQRGAGGRESRLEGGLVAVRLQRGQLGIRHTARGQPAPAAAVHDLQFFGPPVCIRPALPEWSDRHGHERRMLRSQRCRRQTARFSVVRGEVVHEQVGVDEQAIQRGTAFGVGEVRGHAALVGVDGREQPAHRIRVCLTRWQWPAPACPIAAGGLDLDDLSAQIGEQLGRPRCRHHLPHLDDTNAVKAARRHRKAGCPRRPRAPLRPRGRLAMERGQELKATRA